MAVLKYSDLADSGLYIKASTKGQANGVASLDATAKVPLTQLPDGIGGGTQGIQGIQGFTGAQGIAGSGSSGSSGYTFRVNFSSTNVSSVETSTLPTGWSVVNVAAPAVTIQHNTGKTPKFVSYMGHDSATSSLRYRNATANSELTVSDSNLTTQFTIKLTSTSVQADDNGWAYVNVSF